MKNKLKKILIVYWLNIILSFSLIVLLLDKFLISPKSHLVISFKTVAIIAVTTMIINWLLSKIKNSFKD